MTQLIHQELQSLMDEYASLSGLTLNSIIIDFYLWDYSKDHWQDMQHLPIHRIRSTFYWDSWGTPVGFEPYPRFPEQIWQHHYQWKFQESLDTHGDCSTHPQHFQLFYWDFWGTPVGLEPFSGTSLDSLIIDGNFRDHRVVMIKCILPIKRTFYWNF